MTAKKTTVETMTTDDRIDLVLSALDEQKAMLAKQGDEIAEIKHKLSVPVVGPIEPVGPPVSSDIWTGLKLDDPLAEYQAPDSGWVNLKRQSKSFPGAQQMLRDAWEGLMTPTGQVFHADNRDVMLARRKEASTFHADDLAGTYFSTPWGKVNTAPECAAALVLLGVARTSPGGYMSSGSQFGPESYCNITSMSDLFDVFAKTGGAPGMAS